MAQILFKTSSSRTCELIECNRARRTIPQFGRTARCRTPRRPALRRWPRFAALWLTPAARRTSFAASSRSRYVRREGPLPTSVSWSSASSALLHTSRAIFANDREPLHLGRWFPRQMVGCRARWLCAGPEAHSRSMPFLFVPVWGGLSPQLEDPGTIFRVYARVLLRLVFILNRNVAGSSYKP